MWTSTRPTGADHSTRSSRRVGVAVALLACVGLAACTATDPPSPASTTEADTIAPFPTGGVLDAGTYLVTLYPVPFEVTVPDGWGTGGGGLTKDDGDHPSGYSAILLSFWPAYYVPTDACAWKGALVEIGPTAEAFVDAMTAQTSTVTTPPVKVMVGDYSGFEFDHAAESDVDITGCDSWDSASGSWLCANSDLADNCNGRGLQTVGHRATYRVVDLNGERAVIAVDQYTESSPTLIKEARAIFDSIEFVGPDE
jgi:hypothetical protein